MTSPPGHVALLALLTALSGALFLVVGLSLLILAAGAAAELAQPIGSGLAMAAGVTATGFAVLAAAALAWGGVHVWAASTLHRRLPKGRLIMLALGVCNLMLFPLGTALGVYALWVLLSQPARASFDPHPHPSPPV